MTLQKSYTKSLYNNLIRVELVLKVKLFDSKVSV